MAVVPAYLAMPAQVEPMARCLVSLWATAPGIQAIVVDDASPETAYVDQLAAACDELSFELVRRPASSGLAAAINVGLRAALDVGADALVVDASVEFDSPGWLEALQARTDSKGRPAALVGARLMQRHGLIAEAGMYFSLLRRAFLQRYANAPGDLPAALVPTACPVGGRLQLIRHETLAEAGLYDEGCRAGHGDVHYALRVFGAAGSASTSRPPPRRTSRRCSTSRWRTRRGIRCRACACARSTSTPTLGPSPGDPVSTPRTLFVGKNMSGICWYRCALPAMALGHECRRARGPARAPAPNRPHQAPVRVRAPLRLRRSAPRRLTRAR